MWRSTSAVGRSCTRAIPDPAEKSRSNRCSATTTRWEPRARASRTSRSASIGSEVVTGPTPSSEDLALVEQLRAGDETAFMELLDQLQPAMLRVARMYVSTTAVAEEVVQDAWLGVLRGLHSFEGRSSLRTWIFRILTNI